jgi:hypothetical protein
MNIALLGWPDGSSDSSMIRCGIEDRPFADENVRSIIWTVGDLFNLLDDEVRCEPKPYVDDSELTIICTGL